LKEIFEGDSREKVASAWKREQILDQIYGQHRFTFNTLDNQKGGKHSYFALEFFEEEIYYRITYTKKTTINDVIHIVSYLNPRWRTLDKCIRLI